MTTEPNEPTATTGPDLAAIGAGYRKRRTDQHLEVIQLGCDIRNVVTRLDPLEAHIHAAVAESKRRCGKARVDAAVAVELQRAARELSRVAEAITPHIETRHLYTDPKAVAS